MTFGELTAIVNMTASIAKLFFARIYVKVAHLKDLPQKVEINSKLRKWFEEVILENLPNVCYVCKKMGHWAKNCPLKLENKKKIEIVEKKVQKKV